MTAYEMGRAFGRSVARGRSVIVSRDGDPASAQFAGGFISGLMSSGTAVEYLAVVSNPNAGSAVRSAETSAHVHVRGHSMTVRSVSP
jgi:phosphomannomutase